MPSFLDLLVVIGMFMLRFGVPLLIVVGLGYLLKRLDARWEAEAREYAATHPEAAVQPAAQKPAERPAAPVRAPSPRPGPAMPFIIPPAPPKEQRLQAGMTRAAQHCWDVKGCSESSKADCAAYKQPDKPCWQARFDEEGHIPEDCVNCDIFQRYPAM